MDPAHRFAWGLPARLECVRDIGRAVPAEAGTVPPS